LKGERLEGMLAQVVTLVTELVRASGGAQARMKPVRLPPRVSLAGREELLAEVGTRLRSGDDPGPRLVALFGLGGAGKTSVAVEYAHRQLAEVGVAWQFPAEDATVLADGFGELAAQLGVRGPAANRESVASVHAVLAGFAAPWLLIFDNAADMGALTGFLPPAGPGQVLVTSQNPGWPQGQALRVPLLGTEVAADFLVRRTSDPDRQAAAELGGLPLALEQAAAYTVAAGESLKSTWRCSGNVGRTCCAAASPRDTARRWPAPGRWRSTACKPRPRRSGCCGCWRFSRPRRYRCAYCCSPARGWPGGSARR